MIDTAFQKKTAQLKTINRYRELSLPRGLDFSSNDYLGFKDHPALKRAALEAIENGVGLGAGASRLLRGNAPEHEALESFAAQHYGHEAALFFANGFIANYAVFTTLPTRHDVVIYDALVHASVRDGIHAGAAKSIKIPHNDLNAFEDALKRSRDQAQQIYIAVESLYSMDGDIAPLEALYALAQQYGAILIVDEAHSTGVYGDQGKGLCAGLPRDNLIVLHTCGKALGVAGGIITADKSIIDYLINAARPFIYSTAPPPLQAHLALKAIEFCAGTDGDQRRARLQSLCRTAQQEIGGHGTQIIPVILGADEAALMAAQKLQQAGYDIRAIRPPTVPENTARLRLSLNADIRESDLKACLAQIQSLAGR